MKIRGRAVSTTVPRPDWNQADPKKADYIRNKPTELEVVRGYSAYQVAVMKGFEGTEEEWLASLQGVPGVQGKVGPAGAVGPAGEDGYTPVKGVDYYTPDDKAEFEALIVDEMATRGQLKPEFANGIEECTDTAQLYVLPDGNLYAYMRKNGALFTNHLENAVDANGDPYNGGLGYLVGYYLTTAGVEQDKGDSYVGAISGFIPYNLENQIKVAGLIKSTNIGNIFFYAEDKSTIITQHTYVSLSDEGSAIYEESALNGSDVFTFDLEKYTALHSWYASEIKSKAKYIRVTWNLNCSTENAYVLLNEELEFGTTHEWDNTGHAFVPADYEDRIIELEETAEGHESRIATLEKYGADMSSEEISAYIKEEAEDVMARVMEKQGNRSFTMIALSDFHYGGIGDNKDNLIRACKAVSYIKGRINVDAIATLGDNVPFGATDDTVMTNAHRYFKEINEILELTQGNGIVNFRTPGNHDRMGFDDADGNPTAVMPDNALYSYISGYSRQIKMGDVPGGWGYYDFDSYKLRVIVVNSVECDNGLAGSNGQHRSTKQYNWLIDTLDLSGKDSAENWQIIILSHHRGDEWQEYIQESSWGENGFILPNILHAYNTGGTFTGTRRESGDVITCDFSGKNAAKLIGVIHGHHHTYKYGNLLLGDSGGSETTNVMAISTPTTAFVTGGNADNDGNTYASVKDTAEETAFCVYSIDLDNHVIHAIHYGAGIDREINY